MALFTPTMFYKQPILGPDLPDIDQTNLLRWYDADFGHSSGSLTWTDQTGNQDADVVQPMIYDDSASPYHFESQRWTSLPAHPEGIGNYAADTADLSKSSLSIQMWLRTITSVNYQACAVSLRSGTGSSNVRFSIHLNSGAGTAGLYNGSTFKQSAANSGGTNFTFTQSINTWYFYEFLLTTSTMVVYQNNSLKGTLQLGINTSAGDEKFGIGKAQFDDGNFDDENWYGDIGMCLVYDTNTRPTGNWDATKARFGY